MTPTLTNALAELHALLSDTALGGVDCVYDHEPDRETTGTVYVSVMLERITPTEQVWAVRIYAKTADSPEQATRGMYVALDAVDDRLKQGPYGPSSWEVGMVDALDCLVARSFLEVGRETF